jgi:uncharacterized lipoprotein
MQSLNKYFLIATLTLAVLFSGCSTTPKHLVVAPELFEANTNIYLQKQAQLTINDLRRARHIAQILKKDKAAELYSAQQSLATIIETTLAAELGKQGLAINLVGANKIEVIIDAALISVQQELLKYQANNAITLRVIIKNAQQTLTKNFKINGSSEGPFNADIAVLERDFNQQLTKLLTQVLHDKEIQQFIR